MAGFIHGPISDINNIRHNLHDRYRTDFTVVKELIQNTDDAPDATCLDIGWIPSVPGAQHQLLQGPVLFVVNNGRFTLQDAEAICQMGLSNKAADRATIGKFGLGMKSVFHLCEAVFYLASDHADLWPASTLRNNILNPWSGSASGDGRRYPHDSWDLFSEADQAAIRACLAPVLSVPCWFCVLIPLRRETHCEADDKTDCHPIQKYYPGDNEAWRDEVLGEDVQTAIAHLLPLLRHIGAVRGWRRMDVQDPNLQRVFALELDGESPGSDMRRCRYQPEMQLGQSPLRGVVQVTDDIHSLSYRLVFGGCEVLLADPLFDRLKAEQFWPSSSSCNPVTNAPDDDLDKAEPHCAVYFAHDPRAKQKRELATSWAVFLPIEDSPAANDVAYALTLHGYFFVDAGRSDIVGISKDGQMLGASGKLNVVQGGQEKDGTVQEAFVRQAWNQLLAREGTLRLILPALDEFVRVARLPPDQITALTRELAKATLFTSNRDDVCAKHAWVRCLTPQGFVWRLIDSHEPLFEVPALLKFALGGPTEVFPNVMHMGHVTEGESDTRLTHADTVLAWTETQLVPMLDIPLDEVFRSENKLEYLVTFLEVYAPDALHWPMVARKIRDIVRQAFASQPLNRLRKRSELVQRLLRFVPSDQRFALDGKPQTLADDVLSALLRLELGLLLVPGVFEPSTKSEGQLSVADSQTLLQRLAQPDPEWRERDGFDDLCTSLAIQIVDKSKQREEALRRCAGLALFKAHDCCGGQDTLATLNTLRQVLASGTLFRDTPQSRPTGLADALQTALPKATVTLVSKDMAGLLGLEAEQLHICDANVCLALLSTQPALANPEGRARLLVELLRAIKAGDSSVRQSLRYLLHASPGHFGYNEDLFNSAVGEGQAMWGGILSQTLAQMGDDWRVIPETLASRLNPQQSDLLGVQTASPSLVQDFLRGLSTSEIRLSLSDAERRQLMLDIDDAGLLRRLAIHESLDGTLVAIDESTFLEGDVELPPELGCKIKVIRRSADNVLAARQSEMIPKLDTRHVISVALRQDDPSRYWQTILSALRDMATETIPRSLLPALRETAWLPTAKRGRAAPRDVLHVPGLADEIVKMPFRTQLGLVGLLDLDERVRRSDDFSIVRKELLRPSDEMLVNLGMVMALEERYFVGPFAGQFGCDQLNDFLQAFQAAGPDVMAAQRVLKALCDKAEPYGPAAVLEHLMPQLLRPLAGARSMRVLQFLVEQDQKAAAGDIPVMRRLYNRYLAAAAQDARFRTHVLPHILLLNQENNWKKPDQLCHAVHGIAPLDLLDREQAQIIMAMPSSAEPPTQGLGPSLPPNDAPPQTGIQKLEQYLDRWLERVRPGLIGGFLIVLGNEPNLDGLARKYRGEWNPDTIRSMLRWQADSDPERAMLRDMGFVRYIFQIEPSGDHVQVESLLGSPFAARLVDEDKLPHLIVGDLKPWHVKNELLRYYRIRLRQIDLRQICREEQLSRLLRETAHKILSQVYEQDDTGLEAIWAKLEHSEQLTIEVAQDQLIQSAFTLLRQYNLNTDKLIGPVLDRWRDIVHEETEAKVRVRMNPRSGSRSYEQEKSKIAADLKDLLQNNEAATHTVLCAVRSKIGDFQYRPESVPFEIFQNSDDAVVELELLHGRGSPARGNEIRFAVMSAPGRVAFAHWGRRINQYRNAQGGGETKGYKYDLEKMLVLQESDKSVVGAETVTGKFGLGFKSVYLVSARPRVLSGDLGFAVVGGVYPANLRADELRELQGQLDHLDRTAGKSGTIADLPLDKSLQPGMNEERLLRDFLSVLHILLAFSRRIKRCELRQGDDTRLVAWDERRLAGTKRVYIGQLQPFNGKPGPALLLRSDTKPGGAVLMQLDSKGFRPLPDDVPTVWVTTPTRERLGVGFAVNAPFDLDVGRAQLAKTSEKNRDRARMIGAEIGEALSELFHSAEGERWLPFCEALSLAASLKPYDFWASLWQRLVALASLLPDPWASANERSVSAGESADVLQQMMCGTPDDLRGALQFLAECRALPSSLSGDYQRLTSLGEVRYAAQGALNDPDVFGVVSGWPWFRTNVKPGEVVAATVGHTIGRLLHSRGGWRPLSLRQVIEGEVGPGHRVDPETASRLGQLVTPDFLAKHENEKEELLTVLSELEFRGEDDRYHSAPDLLIANSDSHWDGAQDEWARASFAPKGRVLAAEYKGDAQAFLRACRKRLDAKAEELAKWAVDADYRTQRAVLDYLLRGALGQSLADELQDKISRSWLGELTDDVLRRDFGYDADDGSVIRGRLRIVEKTPIPPPPPPPGPVLARIHDWWLAHQAEELEAYEKNVYPGGQWPAVSQDDFHETERAAWMTIFVLALGHSMGRTRLEQHRGFLQLCRDRRWFEVFAAPNPQPADWIRVLDEYMDDYADAQADNLQYHQWILRIVDIYYLTKDLPQYVRAFLGINRTRKPFAMSDIVRPRRSSLYQGGGIDAPPLPIRLGANFILRELVRHRVVASPHAYEHCYVATKKVRDLLARLGCDVSAYGDPGDSRTIQRFLSRYLGPEQAAFDLAFDLPFSLMPEESMNRFLEGS